MKANELRIGNFVTKEDYDQGEKIFEYTYTVRGYDIEQLEVNGYLPDSKEIQPIPLTKEWLLKFGFEEDNYKYVKGVHQKIFSGVMKFEFNEILEVWEFSIGSYNDLTRIEYVHQLQNLYFALTGEELTPR